MGSPLGPNRRLSGSQKGFELFAPTNQQHKSRAACKFFFFFLSHCSLSCALRRVSKGDRLQEVGAEKVTVCKFHWYQMANYIAYQDSAFQWACSSLLSLWSLSSHACISSIGANSKYGYICTTVWPSVGVNHSNLFYRLPMAGCQMRQEAQRASNWLSYETHTGLCWEHVKVFTFSTPTKKKKET